MTVGLNFTPTYDVKWSSLFTVLASLRRLRHLHIEELTRYSIVSEERSQQQVNAPQLVALVLQRLVTFSTHSHLHDYLAHLRGGGTCRHLYLSRLNCMSTWPVLPSVRVLRLMNRDSSRTFRQTLELVDSQLRRCLPSLERLLIERNTESCLIWWQKKNQGPHYYEDEAPFEGACTRWQEKVAVPISWLPTGRLATPDKSWNRQGLEGNSDATLRSWFTVYLIEM